MSDDNRGTRLKEIVNGLIDRFYAYFTSDYECEYVEAKKPERKLIDFQLALTRKKR